MQSDPNEKKQRNYIIYLQCIYKQNREKERETVKVEEKRERRKKVQKKKKLRLIKKEQIKVDNKNLSLMHY